MEKLNKTGALAGKKILITGSTDGLGKLIARHLAAHNASILLHGRDREKGFSAVQEIKSLSHNENLTYYNGDYASLKDVKELAEKIINDNHHIDILINNVGIGSGKSTGNKRELSRDGFELRFAVNYLAHVLLTEKLLSILRSDECRIINVASIGQEPIDFGNLMLERGYDGFFAYKQSKAALVMYTFDLAKRLANRGIKVNAVHPASLMNTKMVLKDWGYTLTTVEQGAEAVEELLFTGATGEYYDGKKISRAINQPYDTEARESLKKITFNLLEKFL